MNHSRTGQASETRRESAANVSLATTLTAAPYPPSTPPSLHTFCILRNSQHFLEVHTVWQLYSVFSKHPLPTMSVRLKLLFRDSHCKSSHAWDHPKNRQQELLRTAVVLMCPYITQLTQPLQSHHHFSTLLQPHHDLRLQKRQRNAFATVRSGLEFQSCL